MSKEIYVVGMGPGEESMMTGQAIEVLEKCDVIIGYTVYLDLLGARFADKEFLSTPMRQETKRCRMCFEKAMEGKRVAMVCSGDAGIYGMACLMLEIGKEYPDCEVVVIPGITAASSGAAVLGAPLNHDFCVISLSDLLTPWERIEKRSRRWKAILPWQSTILRVISVRIICSAPAIFYWAMGQKKTAPVGMWRISAEKEPKQLPAHLASCGMQR